MIILTCLVDFMLFFNKYEGSFVMTIMNETLSNRENMKSKLGGVDVEKVWNVLSKGGEDTSYGDIDNPHMSDDDCKWDQWGRNG